ncbi:MAG: hypothetical protein ACI4IK_05395 [Eubacterium sp.]
MNNNFFNKANGKSKIDVDKMKQAAEQGRLDDFISQNLSSENAARLNEVLSSKEETERLLSSPQAQELMKKLGIK